MKVRANTEKLKDFIVDKFINDELDNESLVQIIELCGDYLNLKTISAYAKERKMNYNAAKKPYNGRSIRTLFGVKFVIDNGKVYGKAGFKSASLSSQYKATKKHKCSNTESAPALLYTML